ncbi:MAG TPA: hypothetical protein VHT30_13490 [Acidimicrobiales bacterium]|jgi:hypothetical protein|nr:hypothetical protein [Acidimicrobiales bacterium]
MGYKHRVERVAVVGRELASGQRMSAGDVECVKAIGYEGVEEVIRCVESMRRPFNGDLPDGGGGNHDLVTGLGDDFAGSNGQARIVGEPPEQNVRVDQDPHSSSPWKAPAMSSGSSSKSEWI